MDDKNTYRPHFTSAGWDELRIREVGLEQWARELEDEARRRMAAAARSANMARQEVPFIPGSPDHWMKQQADADMARLHGASMNEATAAFAPRHRPMDLPDALAELEGPNPLMPAVDYERVDGWAACVDRARTHGSKVANDPDPMPEPERDHSPLGFWLILAAFAFTVWCAGMIAGAW